MIVENGLGAYLCTRAHLDEYYNFLPNLCFITTWNIFDAVDHSSVHDLCHIKDIATKTWSL